MSDDATAHARLTRRRFLAALGAGAAVAAGGGYVLSEWSGGATPDRSGAAPGLGAGALGRGHPHRTLVVVELGGGNDALNMVVPHADGHYHDLRPTLGVTDVIDLDGAVGFHPRDRKSVV